MAPCYNADYIVPYEFFTPTVYRPRYNKIQKSSASWDAMFNMSVHYRWHFVLTGKVWFFSSNGTWFESAAGYTFIIPSSHRAEYLEYYATWIRLKNEKSTDTELGMYGNVSVYMFHSEEGRLEFEESRATLTIQWNAKRALELSRCAERTIFRRNSTHNSKKRM